jgi:phospholipid transport system substrate-binding protein
MPRSILRLTEFLLVGVIAATLAAAPARADVAADARDLVRTVSDRVIAAVAGGQMSPSARESRFRAVYRDYFDNTAIAAWALGPAWRRATEYQRRAFAGLFESFVVKSLSERLANYEGERIVVVSSEVGGNVVDVRSLLISPDPRAKRSIEVEWRLRQVGGRLKVYDLIVDKISMALTLRREIASLLKESGGSLSALLVALRREVADRAASATRMGQA